MMDVIVSHPRDILYPHWMNLMNDNKHVLDRVIIVMTQTSRDRDYTGYVAENVDNAMVVRRYIDYSRDWRNSAVNEALQSSVSEHVLFLEQDFLVKEGFFSELLRLGKEYASVGFRQGNRFHPACLMVKRSVIEQTSKDFSVEKDVGDHFSKFSTEIAQMGKSTDLGHLQLPEWHHIAGLTQNYRMDSLWYQPKEFYTYLHLTEEYPQPNDWRVFSKEKKLQMGKMEIDDKIKSFFAT